MLHGPGLTGDVDEFSKNCSGRGRNNFSDMSELARRKIIKFKICMSVVTTP